MLDSPITRQEFQNTVNAIRVEMKEQDDELRKMATSNSLQIKELTSLKDLKEDVSHLYSKTNANTNQIGVLLNAFDSLKELPAAIHNLDKTIVMVQENVSALNSKLTNFMEENKKEDEIQNNKISSIDNKSKIDIIDYLKKHWLEVCVLLAGGATIVDKIVQ